MWSCRRDSGRRAPSCLPAAKSTLAIIVFVPKDVPALPVLLVLDATLLACTHVSIRSCARFAFGDARLSALSLRDLLVCQLARLHALLDPVLLIDIALNIGLHALRRR